MRAAYLVASAVASEISATEKSLVMYGVHGDVRTCAGSSAMDELRRNCSQLPRTGVAALRCRHVGLIELVHAAIAAPSTSTWGLALLVFEYANLQAVPVPESVDAQSCCVDVCLPAGTWFANGLSSGLHGFLRSDDGRDIVPFMVNGRRQLHSVERPNVQSAARSESTVELDMAVSTTRIAAPRVLGSAARCTCLYPPGNFGMHPSDCELSTSAAFFRSLSSAWTAAWPHFLGGPSVNRPGSEKLKDETWRASGNVFAVLQVPPSWTVAPLADCDGRGIGLFEGHVVGDHVLGAVVDEALVAHAPKELVRLICGYARSPPLWADCRAVFVSASHENPTALSGMAGRSTESIGAQSQVGPIGARPAVAVDSLSMSGPPEILEQTRQGMAGCGRALYFDEPTMWSVENRRLAASFFSEPTMWSVENRRLAASFFSAPNVMDAFS